MNTKQPNKRIAEQMEAAWKRQLAVDAGIKDRSKIPTLAEFEKPFMDAIEVRWASKPRTVAFYRDKMASTVKFPPLGSAKLDRVNEGLIEKRAGKSRQRRSTATCRPSGGLSDWRRSGASWTGCPGYGCWLARGAGSSS